RILLRHAVPEFFDRADEVAHSRTRRIVLHGCGVGGEVDVSAVDAGRRGERPLDRACAGGARHSRDRQSHAFRGCRLHSGTSEPSDRTTVAIAPGLTRSVSYSTTARALSRSTAALVTPGVADSFFSTVRAQLAHVMPPTLRFKLSLGILL